MTQVSKLSEHSLVFFKAEDGLMAKFLIVS